MNKQNFKCNHDVFHEEAQMQQSLYAREAEHDIHLLHNELSHAQVQLQNVTPQLVGQTEQNTELVKRLDGQRQQILLLESVIMQKQTQMGKMHDGYEKLQKDFYARSEKYEKLYNEEVEMLMKAENEKEYQRLKFA